MHDISGKMWRYLVNWSNGRYQQNERTVIMFSKLKNRFSEKGKKAVALLTMAALLCGFTGCGKEETGSSASNNSLSVSVDKSNISQSPAINSNNTVLSDDQTTQNSAQSNFDFDEAVKNINLFGQKISLPCSWSDFGEDFSHDEMYFSSDDGLMCGLLYKGKLIGSILFDNCADAETTAEAESNQIVCVVIGFTNYGYPYNDTDTDFLDRTGYYTGKLELALGDISMSSSENDIIAELGEPSKITEGGSDYRYLDYKYDDGYLHFVFNFNKGSYRIMRIYINVYSI